MVAPFLFFDRKTVYQYPFWLENKTFYLSRFLMFFVYLITIVCVFYENNWNFSGREG